MEFFFECKFNVIKEDNKVLRKEIAIAREKRAEASTNAKKLAESNFYLENVLCDTCLEIYRLKNENEQIIHKIKNK